VTRDEKYFKQVTDSLQEWRQGDCVVSPVNFFYYYDTDRPISPAAEQTQTEAREETENEDDLDPIIVEEVMGLVVLTQTCDLVGDAKRKPFVEVAPILKANSPAHYNQISSGYFPRLVNIPLLRNELVVADLDRVMTIEKPVLTKHTRVRGCGTDEERRKFSEALSRKRARSALPNDFNDTIKTLTERWKEKHEKQTAEGKMLRSLKEIRVQPSSSWDSEKVTVRFWFIEEPSSSEEDGDVRAAAEKQIEQWLLIPKTEGTRFKFESWFGSYRDMGADEYIYSDRLDYDHLS
jgi:hypothetical protein